MTKSAPFWRFWNTDTTRETFLKCLRKDDLLSLRLVCAVTGQGTAPLLFRDVRVTFRSTTFTRHSRVAALERIGHHIRRFQFNTPHSSETFLAPLIDSNTGEAVSFVYEPYTCAAKDPSTRLSLPCYGSWELTDLLVRQYPPLFHAAANVPSFIKALSSMPKLSHLVVSCPSQDKGQRQRRSIVDYALISLRIAIERNTLPSFKALSLLDVHPAACLYLNPNVGFGSRPSSLRRWRQVRSLRIRIGVPKSGSSICVDHLKHLHSYLRVFAPCVRRLDFSWLGQRSPCPIALTADETMRASAPAIACPTTCNRPLEPLRFARLRDLKVANTFTDASPIARFIARHHRAVKHTHRLRLKFDDTMLRTGTWDEALEPLTQMSGSDSWKSSSEESGEELVEDSMEVPIMFSPVDEKEDELHKVWDDHMVSRSIRPHHSGLSTLQRAGVKTKELLFGTEEHMRRIFSSTVLGWR